jgi:hypothetical protein
VYKSVNIGTNCLSDACVTIGTVQKTSNMHVLPLCLLKVVEVVMHGHEISFEAGTNREVKYDCILISVKVTAEQGGSQTQEDPTFPSH